MKLGEGNSARDPSSTDGQDLGPILVIGAAGMLGRAWVELLTERGIDFLAATRSQIDIADTVSIERSINNQYPTVVNCAAWTDVDGAEKDYDAALAVNGHAVAALADRCKQVGSTLVHYSTDYVFNGAATSPYPTDHPREPINAYGRSKAVGEEAIEASGCTHLIARTSWLYAPWGKNFVATIASLVQQRDTIRVVDDQHGRPTSCQHLAAATLALLEHQARGTYHVTDGGQCTWFDFAAEIARIVGSGCRVEPCESSEYPRPATRPGYSVLDLTKTEAAIGPMPNWKDNLSRVMRAMETVTP